MKNLSAFVLSGLLVGSVANAIFVPGSERPLLRGNLTYIAPTKPVSGLKALSLTLLQKEDADEPTSFTLTEDTGIRCVTAPCPSTQKTRFNIQKITSTRAGVKYEAVEVLKNVPPHVRIAPRHLVVNQSEMEMAAPGGGGFMHRTTWDVEVKKFASPSDRYFSYPEPVASYHAE